MSGLIAGLHRVWTTDPRRDPNPLVYFVLAVTAVAYPVWAQVSTDGQGDFLISVLADAGVYVLLALGLNVVVGFAGLLDLGYAAFFAIGAYTYAFLASETPGGHAVAPRCTCRSGSCCSSGCSWRPASVSSSARRPSGCAATTWRS